ncbi:N-acyl-L-amino acid amidohydrolase [Scardovia inopinata]|uniref:Amidohydrolase n=1 Tax=Scardovia inopinata F0304 TaxID=641146 RepID=W5IK41_SCAIO|nr:N-acetyldiaminopimelate deacetylase [Scardovia inopinata]EFG27292.2 amidohydrolase [Scardovia inopinata F0304]BAR06904.1 conserved hypothetical protein [Scardovia inopinata JCM 12537]SUV50969.1 N-acyl-L-amino acid amidohydrolase [Scardovia inopinata]
MMEKMSPVLTEANLISIRRNLHQIPEPALKEVKTQAYVLKVISGMNQEFLQVRVPENLSTAVLVLVSGFRPRRTIAYRADMDALPIEEKTDLPFSSTNPGYMHACGHDIHMAVALGVLSYFSVHQPEDNLIFFFQPAEEAESGAKRAYESGIFTGEWKPDEFYALHDTPDLPAGQIGCRMGTLFAGTTEVTIDIEGVGGHAAFPQDSKDALMAAAALIMQAQTIISRGIDPVQGGVLTLGKIQAGRARNIIAGHAHIEGTIRGLSQNTIQRIDDQLLALCRGLEEAYSVTVSCRLHQGGYLPVVNDPHLTKNLIHIMKALPGVDYSTVEPAMTGEDFGYLLARFPGTMFWLGVDDESCLHTATFNPKESAIGKGVEAVCSFISERMHEV